MKGLDWSYRLTVWVCRRLFPSVAKYEEPARPYEELRKEFRLWEILVFCLTGLFGIITGLFWIWVFMKLGAWRFSLFPQGALVLTASWLLWLPGLFMGVPTGAFLAYLLVRRWLKSRYRDYLAYQNQKFRVNNEKMGFVLGGLITAAPLIMLLMLLNWYVIFTPEQIIIKPLLALTAHNYRYSEVEDIRTVPALTAWTGKTGERQDYVITFRDGRQWATSFSPTPLSFKRKAQIFMYVTLKSDLQITEKGATR
jgi:hypothetical protein